MANEKTDEGLSRQELIKAKSSFWGEDSHPLKGKTKTERIEFHSGQNCPLCLKCLPSIGFQKGILNIILV